MIQSQEINYKLKTLWEHRCLYFDQFQLFLHTDVKNSEVGAYITPSIFICDPRVIAENQISMVCEIRRIHFLKKKSNPHALLYYWFHITSSCLIISCKTVIAKFWISIKSALDILNLNRPHRSRVETTYTSAYSFLFTLHLTVMCRECDWKT